MKIYKLGQDAVTQTLEYPEAFPNIQFFKAQPSGKILAVINSQFAIDVESKERDIDKILYKPWIRRNTLSIEKRIDAYEKWLNGFDEISDLEHVPLSDANIGNLKYILDPFPPHPVVIYPNVAPYGHLPLKGKTGNDDIFYRCECTPVSKRINQNSESIEANTYAFPISEIPFIPTGLSVVGRYALPIYFPACFRWEIQPKPRTDFKAGACVPQFGQSGGGVEVLFPNKVYNRGPIANPVVLPAL